MRLVPDDRYASVKHLADDLRHRPYSWKPLGARYLGISLRCDESLPSRDEPKVGRNDPCPCGSGKKYKKCHGAAA